jgi:hypothetical protein
MLNTVSNGGTWKILISSEMEERGMKIRVEREEKNTRH